MEIKCPMSRDAPKTDCLGIRSELEILQANGSSIRGQSQVLDLSDVYRNVARPALPSVGQDTPDGPADLSPFSMT